MKLYKKVPRYNSTWTHVISDNYPEATLQDIRAAAKVLGFAVVPLEPTEAMLVSSIPYLDEPGPYISAAYKAMLAAAQED